jgi:hypothetical protein
MTSLERGLRDFAQFAAKLKGDEKSEAQTSRFQLLAAFGHDASATVRGRRCAGDTTAVAGAGVSWEPVGSQYVSAFTKQPTKRLRWPEISQHEAEVLAAVNAMHPGVGS